MGDKIKFAHFADCHIGSWRDPKLRDASTKAFVKAIDLAIKEIKAKRELYFQ